MKIRKRGRIRHRNRPRGKKPSARVKGKRSYERQTILPPLPQQERIKNAQATRERERERVWMQQRQGFVASFIVTLGKTFPHFR